jgi:hypothetical protein
LKESSGGGENSRRGARLEESKVDGEQVGEE